MAGCCSVDGVTSDMIQKFNFKALVLRYFDDGASMSSP